MTILERVKILVAEHSKINIKKITPNSSLIKNLKMDEMDCFELLLSIEVNFSLDISDADWEKLYTVQNIADYIENKNKAHAKEG